MSLYQQMAMQCPVLVMHSSAADTEVLELLYITASVFKKALHTDTVMGNQYAGDCGPGGSCTMMDAAFRRGDQVACKVASARSIEVYAVTQASVAPTPPKKTTFT